MARRHTIQVWGIVSVYLLPGLPEPLIRIDEPAPHFLHFMNRIAGAGDAPKSHKKLYEKIHLFDARPGGDRIRRLQQGGRNHH